MSISWVVTSPKAVVSNRPLKLLAVVLAAFVLLGCVTQVPRTGVATPPTPTPEATTAPTTVVASTVPPASTPTPVPTLTSTPPPPANGNSGSHPDPHRGAPADRGSRYACNAAFANTD